MSKVKVLDVTLRDGGCVNNFNFGQDNMNQILKSLEQSGVEYVELGYLDDKNGTNNGRTQFVNEIAIKEQLLKNKRSDIKYLAMMDYGKFNIDKLSNRTSDGIDGIRMAFHKKDWKNVIPLGKKIIEKGYDFFIQPMLTMRYSDEELIELINVVNKELTNAFGFYIVDSFGEMKPTDLLRLVSLADAHLNPNMILGFHSHNNLQLSFANALAMLSISRQRQFMLDSSVLGMGKGAGNLNTELLLEHLNFYEHQNYKLEPLFELIDQVINPIREEFYWGYAIEYYLSSINHCTPSYANYFYKQLQLPIEDVAKLLSSIEEPKRISYDKLYAETLYKQYVNNNN